MLRRLARLDHDVLQFGGACLFLVRRAFRSPHASATVRDANHLLACVHPDDSGFRLAQTSVRMISALTKSLQLTCRSRALWYPWNACVRLLQAAECKRWAATPVENDSTR